MSKDYQDITNSISGSINKFTKDSAELMQAFRSMSQAATKTGVLDEKN